MRIMLQYDKIWIRIKTDEKGGRNHEEYGTARKIH